MRFKNLLIFILPLLLVFACSNTAQEKVSTQTKDTTEVLPMGVVLIKELKAGDKVNIFDFNYKYLSDSVKIKLLNHMGISKDDHLTYMGSNQVENVNVHVFSTVNDTIHISEQTCKLILFKATT